MSVDTEFVTVKLSVREARSVLAAIEDVERPEAGAVEAFSKIENAVHASPETYRAFLSTDGAAC